MADTFPHQAVVTDLKPYEDYIEWQRTYTHDGLPKERALVRAVRELDDGTTYIYVGLPDANDNRTVPSDTEFTVLGKVT